MTNPDNSSPSIRSLALALDAATGPDPAIDAEICRFFFWAGLGHGQADIHKPFEVLGSGVRTLSFTRKFGEGEGTAPVPNITGSIDEAAELVKAFAPHLEWRIVEKSAHSAQSDDRPHAVIAPDADNPSFISGAVSKGGATHAIALVHALLQALGQDGMVLEVGEDLSAVGMAAHALRQIAWKATKDGLAVIRHLSDEDLARLRARNAATIAKVGSGMCEVDFEAAVIDIEERDRAQRVPSGEVPF